jgi:CRISPR-associated protein Csm1
MVNEIKDKEYYTVVLGALLHDVGKISQREGGEYHVKHAEFSGNFINSLKTFFDPDYAKEIANLIEKHHKIPSTRDEYILHIADKLAAAERFKEERGHFKSNEAALVAVTSRIKFRRDHEQERYYRLSSLQIKKEVLFPIDNPRVEEGVYKKVWDRFVGKVKSLGKYQPSDFGTLFFILKEIGTFVPSATPWEEDEYNRTVPDVSLFDHSKVTCAITACLKQLSEEDFSNNEMSELIRILRQHYKETDLSKMKEILNSSKTTKKPLFIFLRADIAGIQKFIYSITKPKAETKGTSKRLRGRSFYVSLLTDVLSDWIVKEMDLPITNILFCGGGRFDLLLPNTNKVRQKISEIKTQLDTWFLKEFYGELNIQIATVEIVPKDFFDFNKVYKDVEDELAEIKMRKFERLIQDANFFKSIEKVEDLCNSCQIIPVSKGKELCDQCETYFMIGSHLPKKDFITFVYGKYKGSADVLIPFERFGITVLLQDRREVKRLLKEESKTELHIYCINPEFSEKHGLDFLEDNREKKPVSFGFKFLGNSVPINNEGDVLEFEEIANLSTGAKYLGVLKMDVDYLGMLFALGIDQPSISRISTLSNSFEIFFGAWLNKICERLGKIFYIVYSGGDDLFIIGPWDKTIELAREIYNNFREYTCWNPNITLSGGILFVKPHFPIQRFAQLVTEELEKSKHDADKQNEGSLKEKNRITLWGETVEWSDRAQSFEELLTFAKQLTDHVENKEKPLPKGFIYFLHNLEKYFYKKGNLTWVPNFFYSLVRRIKKEEVRVELQSQVPSVMGKMKIPVSYVSLKTRKE